MSLMTIFWRTSIFSALVACGAIGMFYVIGSTVDASGMLHEPFFLIPLFWLAVMTSVCTAIGALIMRWRS